MQLSAKEAWKRVLDEAIRRAPENINRSLLDPTEAVSLEDGRLIVAAPDEFFVQWNESKHAPLLTSLTESALGSPDRHGLPGQGGAASAGPRWTSSSPRPRARGRRRAQSYKGVNQPLNERYTFDNFVIGKSNELAAAAAKAVSEAPGKTLQPAVHLRRRPGSARPT